MAVQSISNVATGAATSTAGKVVDDLAKQCAKAAKAPIGDSVKFTTQVKNGIKQVAGYVKAHPMQAIGVALMSVVIGNFTSKIIEKVYKDD